VFWVKGTSPTLMGGATSAGGRDADAQGPGGSAARANGTEGKRRPARPLLSFFVAKQEPGRRPGGPLPPQEGHRAPGDRGETARPAVCLEFSLDTFDKRFREEPLQPRSWGAQVPARTADWKRSPRGPRGHGGAEDGSPPAAVPRVRQKAGGTVFHPLPGSAIFCIAPVHAD